MAAAAEERLRSFLKQRAVRPGSTCSLTGMGAMAGRWIVEEEYYQEFLDLLNEYLFICKLRPNNLVEQRRLDGITPVTIDLDLKYSAESGLVRRFNMDHIQNFIIDYINSVSHFFDLSSSGIETIKLWVLLRPAPYEDKKHGKIIKDGVHIHCRELCLPAEFHQAIRLHMLEQGAVRSAFGNTGYINADRDIFDEAVFKKAGWFMYGESKPDIPAYSVVALYKYNITNGELEEEEANVYSSRELLEILSIRYKVRNLNLTVRKEYYEEWDRLLGTVYPRGNTNKMNNKIADFLHGSGTGDNAVEKEDNFAQLETNGIGEADIFQNWGVGGCTPEEVELARCLVDQCLSNERANAYQSWIEVGWCLRNIDPSDTMFDCWMNWSARSPKFSKNNITGLRRDWARGWNYNGRKFTLGSLKKWAYADNPATYKQLVENDTVDYIKMRLEGTHTHIARLIYKMYAGVFKAAVDSKKTDWYKYDGNSWQKSVQGLELRNAMIGEVWDRIEVAKDSFRKQLREKDDEFAVKRFKTLHDIQQKLFTAGFKESLMKECVGLFYEEEFGQKLNSSPYLIGFANGVLNLREEYINSEGIVSVRSEFREGRPEDYISFMAGRWLPKQCDPMEYVEYDPDDPINAEIDDFMSKVFPRAELRAYMWRKLASCLEGTNREQRYDTWIGVGGNGKSKLVDLMSMVLGDYATSLQSTVLTRKRPDSGAANPDIMAVRNKRFIYMAEPDDGEPLNTSRMKQFTGEDVVEARGLFEDQSKFQITGKMFMLCNRFPAIHAMDRGTWRRVMAVVFESKFVNGDDPEEAKEIDVAKNVYPRDNNLDVKLKRWRQVFMSRLVHVYETEYLKRGIEPIPLCVRAASENYRAQFDSFGKFKNARLRQCAGAETTVREVYRAYKAWSEIGGIGAKRLTQAELQKRMEDEYGLPADKKTFKRLQVFESDDDVEEWEKETAAAAGVN
jgi:P4 family phage/plasmid primase-like protien